MNDKADQRLTLTQTPNIDAYRILPINPKYYACENDDGHPPRILLLYGSLRKRSFSRLLAEECAYILRYLGAETRTFNPQNLPLADSVDTDHPKVQELRGLSRWSEGMVWVSPERHGADLGPEPGALREKEADT